MFLSFPVLVLLFVAIAMALPGETEQTVAPEACTYVAAPDGSDSAAGTAAAPFASAQKVADEVGAGQIGCLRAGTYNEDIKFSNEGVTLRSYPGERATVVGRVWIARGADRVTVAALNLDGRNPDNFPSPTINAHDSTFVDNDVSNGHTAICFAVGHQTWGRADRTKIRNNRIHDCGIMPANNHDHGIYIVAADQTEVVGNWIFDNADRGIQFYPDAQRSYVAGNVIDGNGQGVIFSGDNGVTSSDNVVENNVITNAKLRDNVESYYPAGTPDGQRNVVRNNCVFGGARDDGDGGIAEERGFTATSNLIQNPRYVDRGAKDFRLAADSPCAALLAGGSAPASDPASGSGTQGGNGQAAGFSTQSGTTTRGKAKVTVKFRKRGRARVSLSGRVSGGSAVTAASAGTKAVVQLRFDGAWYPVRSAPVVRGRFSSQIKLPPAFRGKVVKLRVQVGSVGRSKVIKVRV